MADNTDEIKKGVSTIADNSTSAITNLSDMLAALTKIDSKISTNKPGKNALKVDPSGLTAMLKTVNSINPKLQTFSSNISDVNRGLRSLSNTLLKFSKNNLTENQGSKTTKSGNSARNSFDIADGFSTIKDTLNSIKAEIESFHRDIVTNAKRAAETSASTQTANLSAPAAAAAVAAGVGSSKKLSRKELRDAYKNIETKLKGRQKLSDEEFEMYSQYQESERRRAKWTGNVSAFSSGLNGTLNGFMASPLNPSSMLGGGVNMAGSLLSKAGPWGAVASGVLQAAKAGADMVDRVQGLARDYARTYGGGRVGRDKIMRESSNFIQAKEMRRYGFSNDEYFKAASGLTEMLGRTAYRRSYKDMQSAIGLQRMGVEGESLGMFDTFGRSIQSTDAYFKKLYGKAGKSGLSFKKLTDAIKNNIKLAQSYTFRKGVDGLQRMAEMSTRLKYNMSEVSKFAEKVNTVEEATKTAANLSVLGGEFAQFSNPMGMLYESLNDFEGLNDRMVKMFADMAKWDEEKKQIEISGYDRMRIRAASQAMGVDANEMMNIAMNSQRERMVESQIVNPGKYKKEALDYIRNLAQIDKNGNAYIADSEGNLGGKKGEEIKFSDPRFEKLIPYLENEAKRKEGKENGSIGDVFVETRSIYEWMQQNLQGVSNKLQSIATTLTGDKSMTGAQRSYFNAVKNDEELLKKYGSRHNLKAAIAAGELDDEIAKYAGGEKYVSYLNSEHRKGNKNAIKRLHDTKNKSERSEADRWIKNNIDEEEDFDEDVEENALGWPSRLGRRRRNTIKTHANGGVLHRLEWGEAVWPRDAVGRFGVDNINSAINGGDPFTNRVSNVMDNKLSALYNTMKVAPSQAGPASIKISFDDANINLGGKLDLVNNGRSQGMSFNDMDMRALKKIILDAVKDNIGQIMRQANIVTNQGYVKDEDPYRGSASNISYT